MFDKLRTYDEKGKKAKNVFVNSEHVCTVEASSLDGFSIIGLVNGERLRVSNTEVSQLTKNLKKL